MKNEIFNFRRFGKYFATDIRGCWSNYGLNFMTICILPIIIVYILSVAWSTIFDLSWNGPAMGFRSMAAIISIVCLVMTMPAKCYGKITEKRFGSFWLTLPASRLEKFLSMVLTTCVIAPLLGGALTLGIDGLICVLDPTCGNSIVEGVREMGIGMMNLSREFEEFATNAESQAAVNELISSIEDMEKSVTSPFMIITNFFALTLPFLCGAVWFKSSKIVKTILAMMAFSMVFSIIATPFMTGWLKSAFEINNDLEAINAITENGLFNKIVLINNISKTMTNVALMLGIWFRIKSLKH